jgi:hypothetical protein
MKLFLISLILTASVASAVTQQQQKAFALQNVLQNMFHAAKHGEDQGESFAARKEIDAASANETQISDAVNAAQKLENMKEAGISSVVTSNGTPNNLELDVQDELTLDLSGFFSSDADLPVSFHCDGLPVGLSISEGGLITGQAEQAGQYLVRITGTDGLSTAYMSPFWIVVANEYGEVPSYLPEVSESRSPSVTVTPVPSGTPEPSATRTPEAIPIQFNVEALRDVPAPVVVSAIPNIVAPVSVYFSLDTSDCFAVEKTRLWFTISGLPESMTYDINTGIISGTPDQIGRWDVKVSVTDGLHSSQLPPFNFIVSDDDGHWDGAPERSEE